MRILVIRPGALGDLLLTLPALTAVRGRFPEAHIEVMGTAPWVNLLPGRSPANAVSDFDRAEIASLFQSEPAPVAEVQGYLQSFDLILSYVGGHDQPFVRNLARLASGAVHNFDARPPLSSGVHATEYLQAPLRKLGIPLSKAAPRISPSAGDRQAAGQWWERHGLGDSPVLAIHPGSGSAGKNWPAPRFVEVASHIGRRGGVRVLWVEGPAERAVVAEVQRALGAAKPLVASNLPLPTLAAVLARCRAYLGNDSGVSHLAAAVGTPLVAVFGPTSARVWGPRGPSVRTISGSAPCAPCTPQERARCQERSCLVGVSVVEVLEALAPLLSSTCSGRDSLG